MIRVALCVPGSFKRWNFSFRIQIRPYLHRLRFERAIIIKNITIDYNGFAGIRICNTGRYSKLETTRECFGKRIFAVPNLFRRVSFRLTFYKRRRVRR